jgi:hypothetical protein
MNSGIYQLNFSSGHYYIGKSENIPKRWETHKRNFLQGKHTRKMQWAYDNYGMPDFTILMVIHSDHIDLYEDALIQVSWVDHLILNGTKPQPISQEQLDKLDKAERTTIEDQKIMQLGTLEHIEWLWRFKEQSDNYQNQLEALENKDELVKQLRNLEYTNQALQQEIKHFKQLSWWQRIWY